MCELMCRKLYYLKVAHFAGRLLLSTQLVRYQKVRVYYAAWEYFCHTAYIIMFDVDLTNLFAANNNYFGCLSNRGGETSYDIHFNSENFVVNIRRKQRQHLYNS